MLLIDDLLMLPVKALLAIFEQIRERVDLELLEDEADLQTRLLDLQLRYEIGEITEPEYGEQADALEARLKLLCDRAADAEAPEAEPEHFVRVESEPPRGGRHELRREGSRPTEAA